MDESLSLRNPQQVLHLEAFFRRALAKAPEWMRSLVPDFSMEGWCHVRTSLVPCGDNHFGYHLACSIPDEVLRPALELPIVFEELLTSRVPSDIQAIHLRAVGVARADELNELDRKEERKLSLEDAELTLQAHHRVTARNGLGGLDASLATSLQVLILEELRSIRRALTNNYNYPR